MRIAIIGARGFVGSALCAAVSCSSNHTIVRVVRDTYEEARRNGPYDVVVNAAMPSKRFWAREHPRLDFIETVEKTSRLIYEWQWTKFVQISSISARSQRDTVYGRHKAAAEQLCSFGKNLIIRLGPMYGEGLKKGAIVDLVNDRTVFAAADSRCCFAPVSWVADIVINNLHLAGTIEVGTNDSITLGEIAQSIDSTSNFQGGADHQEPANTWPNAPSARAVVDYAVSMRLLVQGQ